MKVIIGVKADFLREIADAYDFQSNGGKLMRGRPMVYRWLEFITRVCRGKRPRRLNVEIERKTVER